MDVSNLCWMEPVEKLKCQFVMSENRFFSIDKNDQRHWQHTAQSEASVVSGGEPRDITAIIPQPSLSSEL